MASRRGAVFNLCQRRPNFAIDYWQLPQDARLREVIITVRTDEAEHRDVIHNFVDAIDAKRG
ncbi:MAG: alternative oxidase [Erythrobacter sp.]|uniref:alternative oxidase n=1 Tax=Erythrobacter sp. TaxID=1042 RepID=UPI0032987745